MDANPDAQPQPGPTSLHLERRDRICITVLDVDGAPLVSGVADLGLHLGVEPALTVRFTERTLHQHWRSDLLPVRAEREPVAHLHPGTYGLTDTDALTDGHVAASEHTHRHPHHGAPGDPYSVGRGVPLERYDHTHPHAHPKSRDDRAYHDDHQH
jgi:hypothetical protein